MIEQVYADVPGFDSNFMYFVHDGVSKEVAVVDPGDPVKIEALLEENGWQLKAIWLTHSHWDHVHGVRPLLERYQVPVYMHENAIDRVDIPKELAIKLVDEDTVRIGSLEAEVLHTPGHIDDAVCFYIPDDGDLITGDTVFVEGCGRADLDGASVEDLYDSIQRIKTLPDEVKVYSGHDYGSKPVSTIAWEKAENKYFLCENAADFVHLRMG